MRQKRRAWLLLGERLELLLRSDANNKMHCPARAAWRAGMKAVGGYNPETPPSNDPVCHYLSRWISSLTRTHKPFSF